MCFLHLRRAAVRYTEVSPLDTGRSDLRLRRNRVRVVALARMSAMGSAAKMPNTLPVIRGRSSARGTSRITLRRRARKRLVRACPSDIKVI